MFSLLKCRAPSIRRFLRTVSHNLLLIFVSLSVTYSNAISADFTDKECLSCHADASKVKKVFDTTLLADTEHEDNSCTECHTGLKKLDHGTDVPKVNCLECHEEINDDFKTSVHAISKVTEPELITTCTSCHGTHRIFGKKSKESTINRAHISQTCGACHSDSRLIKILARRGAEPVADYQRGSHFLASEKKGGKKPATCMDCHGGHTILRPGDLKSSVNKLQIPQTCGKCHEKERDQYFQSIHWESLQRGNYEMPVCNDCHGEHSNMLPGKRTTKGNAALAESQFCANCHANPVLMERFGLDAGRFSSYMKTYHGLAVQSGSDKAPSCTSCHGAHSIRVQTDPQSTTYKNNLQTTCGECHKDANQGFVQVAVHPKNQKERNPVAYYVRKFYIWLIAGTVGGMLLHNLIILAYYLRARWFSNKKPKHERRFSRFDFIQHLVLLSAFTVLAISGFALKFPNSWWVNLLTPFGFSESARSVMHRFSGVVLIIVSLIQLIYFATFKAGRREFRAILPHWSDFTDFLLTMGYYLHICDRLPTAERYDYSEKLEYLALIWGTIIMVISGLILWFPELFLSFLPIWSFELAEVVHYCEAVLAVAAIFVWHIFFTVFHPKHNSNHKE